jgi:cytochrome-b5 reductase
MYEIKESQLFFVYGAVISLLIALVTLIIVNYGSGDRKNKNEDISVGLKKELQGSITSSNKSTDKVLSAAVFKEFKILQIVKLSKDTKLFRFEIPHGKPLGLPIGRHIALCVDIDGSNVIRSYTPTSRPQQCGYFDLVIKTYEYGKISSYMHKLKPGASVKVRGPVGRFKYVKNTYRTIGLVAGGTGLTPCLQIMKCILEGPEYTDDQTSFVLLYQNREEDDILLKSDLDTLQETFPGRVKIQYYLSKPNPFWGKSNCEKDGYIGKEAKDLLNSNNCQLVCICGPSGFNDCMRNLMMEFGHDENSLYIW